MTGSRVGIIELYPFRFHADHLEYLLLKRAPNDRLYPGIWQIITGSIENDEKATAAALRELQEESGLRPERFWVLPDVSAFYDWENDTIQSCVLFCCQLPDNTDPTLSAEHCDWRWHRAAAAKPLLAWPSQKSHIDLIEETIGRGDLSGKLLDISHLLR